MKLKYWQILLIEQQRQGKKGFAIPYIIGSQKYLPANHIYQNIEKLIIDIVTNDLLDVFLKYCLHTNDLILEIKSKNSVGVLPAYNNMQQSRLCISILNNDLGENVETIIQTLTEKYQQYIDAMQFSINERVRGDFSPQEKELISIWFSKFN